MQGVRTAKLLASLCVLLLLASLCFRAFVYPHLYIAPGDPYGISDIIELLLGWILILALAISAVIALVLGIKGPRFNRLAAAGLGFVVILVQWLLGLCMPLLPGWRPRRLVPNNSFKPKPLRGSA